MNRNILIAAAVVAVVGAVALVKERGGDGDVPATQPVKALPALVELGAGKCAACKAMKPVIEELQKELVGRVRVESIDVLEQPDRARSYDYRLIPSQVFLNAEGRELWRHEGFISREEILAKLKELGML